MPVQEEHASQQLKLCFVVQRYGLEVNGGAELLCRQQAERLAQVCDVTVYTSTAIDYQTWRNEYEPGETELNGVHIVRFPTTRERHALQFRIIHDLLLRNLLPRPMQDLWFRLQGPVVPDLLQALVDNADAFDAFIFHTYLYYPAVYGIPLVARKAIFVPDAHEEKPLHLDRVRQEFETAAALFFNTEEERELAERTFDISNTPSKIGGAGVEVPQHPAPDAFCEKYHIETPYIVYVGRIDEAKGCVEMLQWWERYKRDHDEQLTLVLMGRAAIAIPERDDVRALGFIPEEDKFSGIEGAKFLWLPSRFESLSIVVLEALSLGVPVLVNGGSEVLRGHCKRSAAGVYYTEYEDCVRQMERLLEESPEVALMREKGPRYVEENYQWNLIMSKLLDLVETLA